MGEFSQSIILRRGQCLPQYVRPGTRIVAVTGSLHIEGPLSALDGYMMRPVIVLRDGEAHLVVDTGWICLSAPSGCEVMCLPGIADTGLLWRRLLAVLGLLRRRTVSRYGT